MPEALKVLQLPETYEKISNLLGGSESKNTILSRFILPIQEAEQQLSEITAEAYGEGKVIFILGKPGIGKSTFIHSLMWRPTIDIHTVSSINCSEENSENLLEAILENIKNTALSAQRSKEPRPRPHSYSFRLHREPRRARSYQNKSLL